MKNETDGTKQENDNKHKENDFDSMDENDSSDSSMITDDDDSDFWLFNQLNFFYSYKILIFRLIFKKDIFSGKYEFWTINFLTEIF